MVKPGADKEKELIRQELLDKRRSLTKQQAAVKSKAIQSSLLSLDEYMQANTIHCYISMDQNREVLTDKVIEHALAAGKGVIVPRVEKGGQLSHHLITDLRSLTENKWGVREPENERPVNPERSDIIIVPMTGGDRQKNRLGYGKGYYDRFLSEMQKPVKIGLLYELSLQTEPLPVEDFDVRLDILITESEIIR